MKCAQKYGGQMVLVDVRCPGIKRAEADGLTAWTHGRACSRSDPGLKGGDKKLYSMKGVANGQTESEGH